MPVLLLDAVNTVIEKPGLWDAYASILTNHSGYVDRQILKRNHQLISEVILFPDRTDQSFYDVFNTQLLYSLGIIPADHLLDEIYQTCRSLPWSACPDAFCLNLLQQDISILSNFHHGLKDILEDLFPGVFVHIINSEAERIRKPAGQYFQRALEFLTVDPSEVIYVGDSLKLDIAPAQAAGFNAWLLDRNDSFPCFYPKIRSLCQIADVFAGYYRSLPA